jgi:tRNA C32,U32 (ribose-2'-O)-methylase TrmJ
MSLEGDKALVDLLIEKQEAMLKNVRDVKAHSKSTVKKKLSKIEKHTALVLEELKILKGMLQRKEK